MARWGFVLEEMWNRSCEEAGHVGVGGRLGKEAGLLLLALSLTSKRRFLSAMTHAITHWHELSLLLIAKHTSAQENNKTIFCKDVFKWCVTSHTSFQFGFRKVRYKRGSAVRDVRYTTNCLIPTPRSRHLACMLQPQNTAWVTVIVW